MFPLAPHHRLRRSQGGPDTLANLILLCTVCHRLVHEWPEDGYKYGMLIRSYDGPPSTRWPGFED